MSTDADLAGDRRGSGAQERCRGKAIVLFSDGTGNSSAKLFKTNVWRMYEAVDLGPAPEGKRPQIAYYDDGVGTSSFKPLAALGGAFGWGLKRNVLDIYRYACRNYRDDDDIYVFGFSRGAFTARLVAALILSEGLVCSEDEADLRRKTVRAYRQFRKALLPRRLQWPTKLTRWLRDRATGVADRLLRPRSSHTTQTVRPSIRFIGVWDTVAAYGGPIAEITRAVDNWFFPLSMPHYRLDERVVCARHALAIDDERDAFHPLLWDEVHEADLIADCKVAPDRLMQVWFTGMHADVGGGYPDESLSYVSLLWMMSEAERTRATRAGAPSQGLRMLTVIKDRFRALANSYGPIHNSRSGLGAYYRYQPRRIAAWVDPVDTETLSLRDPAILDDRGRSRGLLRAVRVHESVINRIATGTDRYAPITLPETFEIVPPHEQGENAPQVDSQTGRPPEGWDIARPIVGPALHERLRDSAAARKRREAFEAVWDLVWWRRIVYFMTLAFTLMLAALPLVVSTLPTAPLLTDGRTWIGGVIRLLTIVVPSFAAKWVDVYADNPFYFLVLGIVILLLLTSGNRLEWSLRDRSRRIWWHALEGTTPEVRCSWLERFRNGDAYQHFVQLFKWYVLPDWVIAPLTVLVLAWTLLGAYVQTGLPFLENGVTLCQPSAVPLRPIVRVTRDFSPRDVCSASFGLVHQGERYVVTFDVIEPWYDSSLSASPEGLSASDFPGLEGYFATLLKRVINARFLQPLIEIRPTAAGLLGTIVNIYPLSVRQEGDSRAQFRADFKAARTGELYLFVNDAMLPLKHPVLGLDYRLFYERTGDKDHRGNRGTARVTVELAESTHGVLSAQQPSPAATPASRVRTEVPGKCLPGQ
jgi:uncharacterized protein (DUF2235 family)